MRNYPDLSTLPSVYDYLVLKGYRWVKQGGLYYTNSVYNKSDRTPSLALYPSGIFKDYSSGKSGNVITLARHFGDDLSSLSSIPKTWVPPIEKPKKPWDGIPERYLDVTEEERQQVVEYAESRGIKTGYFPAVTFHHDGEKFVRDHISMMFPHYNEGKVTGGKFRYISPTTQRFTSRGRLGFYLLENLVEGFEEPEMVMVEGEANANSLWEYFKSIGKPCVVGSSGSVTSIPTTLPYQMKGRLLIDFDGSEEKYQERIQMYSHLNLVPMKIILPKGSDINSLYQENKIHLIENLI